MIILMALAFLPATVGASSATPTPSASVPPDAAIIENSGSTNFAGYRIVVTPDGSAWLTLDGGQAVKAQLPAAHARSLFAHLAAAGPLDSLEVGQCVKSASFGTRTFIEWKGVRTGDVSCGGGQIAQLNADVEAILADLQVKPTPRRPAPPQPG